MTKPGDSGYDHRVPTTYCSWDDSTSRAKNTAFIRLPPEFAVVIRPLLALLFCFSLARVSTAEMKAWPVEMIDDADLHDVCHAAAETVWAVGDRGAIWLSKDAGRTWSVQQPLTSARLVSVAFADDPNAGGNQAATGPAGLIVGGAATPYGLPSRGVVLRTTDGGASWKPLDHQLVPALFHVTLDETRSGTAVGDAWAMFPSAVFRTRDGGRSWNSGPGRVSAAWTDADFAMPNRPLLVSRSGTVVAVTRTTMGLPKNDTHHIRAARWMADGTALAVGDDGAVLVSRDGGQTWHDHRSALPPGVADQFDFLTMRVLGPYVWMAGSPGTIILRSADAGKTWIAVPTGQTLPIHAIDVGADVGAPDAPAAGGLRGTAVGALGLRLSTSDAGAHWSSAHAKQRRAGALIIAARATKVPLDLIAHLSAGHGLRCRVALLESDESTLAALEQAVNTVGGDGVTVIQNFQLPSSELTLSAETIQSRWRQQHALQAAAIKGSQRESGAEHLALRLTKQIRTWRPELVFAVGTGEPGLDDVLRFTVAHATRVAGEPGAYPEQISVARLSPWRAQKAMWVSQELHESSGDAANHWVRIDPAEPLPALASSISARVALAETYLVPARDARGEPAQPSVCRLLTGAATTTLLGDLAIPRNGESRRATATAVGDGQWLARRAATHHNIQMLLARLVQRHRSAGSAEQLAPLVRDLAAEEQTRLLYSIAQQFHAAGSTSAALDTLEGILRRQNDDDVHHAASLQKLQWATSVEVQHMLGKSRLQSPSNPLQLAGTSSTGNLPAQPASSGNAVPDINLKKLLRRLPPAARSTEWVQMTEAAARRHGASAADQKRIYQRLRKTLPNGVWRVCATTEVWLAEPKPDPRKPVPATIRQIGRAHDPPRLDGVFSEDFWQGAAVMTLEPLLGIRTPLPAAQVRMARDDQYLYLAIDCHVVEGTTSASTPPGDRQRDSDLSQRDRVEISIDINRDYSSGWHLTIDDRGWANDACQRDPSWNPQWHIARHAGDRSWSIEAAMPWEEIVPPSGQHPVWLVGVRRVIPCLGIATWPATANPRPGWESRGYLLVDQVIHQSP